MKGTQRCNGYISISGGCFSIELICPVKFQLGEFVLLHQTPTSFQLGTIIHNRELFQREEKPSHDLFGLSFVGWSTHELWAGRATVTGMVTALGNCPGQRAVVCLGSAGFPSHNLLLVVERPWTKIFTCASVLTLPFA